MFTILFSLSWAFPLYNFKSESDYWFSYPVTLGPFLSVNEYRELELKAGISRKLSGDSGYLFLWGILYRTTCLFLYSYCCGQCFWSSNFKSLLLPTTELANSVEICVCP